LPDAGQLHRAVRAYLDHLTVERGLAGNTLAAYRRDLARYVDALAEAGVTELGDVTEADVAGHLARLREGDEEGPPLAAASAARAIVAVRGLHRFAVREGLAAADPTREVKPPALPRRLPKALGVDDVFRLLDIPAEDGPLALRDKALLEFLYGTGARISEAVGCAIDDLDLDAGTVTLHGKGGRTRIVPVGAYACQALQAYLVRGRPGLAAASGSSRGAVSRSGRGAASGSSRGAAFGSSRGAAFGSSRGAVFLNARGGRLSRQSAWTILREAAERSGVPASPHTLRHSYATHLLDGGADIRVVQELLGHASVTTTQVYTLVTVERLREVYATSHPRAMR
jgi:integrase/recombinase XerD